MTYFIIVVGVIAAGLIWFIFRVGRGEKKARSSGRKAQHYDPHFEPRHVHEPLHHNDTRSLHPSNSYLWRQPRRHRLEEKWRSDSDSVYASRLRSDEEPEDDEVAEGGHMRQFEYTPVDLPRTSNRKP